MSILAARVIYFDVIYVALSALMVKIFIKQISTIT